MKITKFAQSNILIESHSKKVMIDPGNYNLDKYKKSPDDLPPPDILLITHKHPDHFDIPSIISLCQRGGFTIFTTQENVISLDKSGVDADPCDASQNTNMEPFSITAWETNHLGRAGEIEGQKVDALGFEIKAEEKTLYHPGDTIPPVPHPGKIDLLFCPIGGRNVLTIEEAVELVSEVKPQVVVPIHYDAPQDATVDPKVFADQVKDAKVQILNFGESFEF